MLTSGQVFLLKYNQIFKINIKLNFDNNLQNKKKSKISPVAASPLLNNNKWWF